MAVQEVADGVDHLVAADRVVLPPLAAPVAVVDHVGAVEGVVEGPPPGVRRVERVATVVERNHELRSGHLGDLAVDVAGHDLVPGGDVPRVDLVLQFVASGEQVGIPRGQIGHDLLETGPERLRRDARSGEELIGDEVGQRTFDLEFAELHGGPPKMATFSIVPKADRGSGSGPRRSPRGFSVGRNRRRSVGDPHHQAVALDREPERIPIHRDPGGLTADGSAAQDLE